MLGHQIFLLVFGLVVMDNRYESIKQRSFKDRRIFLIFLNTKEDLDWSKFQTELSENIGTKGL